MSALTDGADIRVSELIDGAVRLEWFEAVALVRKAGLTALGDGADAQLPGPDRMWICDDGTLRMDTVTSGGDFLVPGLSGLLASLLPSSAPPDLQLLSQKLNPSVVSASPEEFFDALTFFARPDDSVELRAVFERATEARQATARAAALHGLTERARHAEPVPAPMPVRAPTSPNRRRFLVAAGVIGALALLSIGAWALTRKGPAAGAAPASRPAAAQGMAQRVQSVVASAAEAVRSSLTTPAAVTPQRSKDIQLGPRTRSRARGRGDIRTAGPEADLEPQSLARLPESASEAPTEQAGTGAAPDDVEVGSSQPFGAGDADVTPPALQRAQMPEVPPGGMPDDRRGVLELLVGEDGQVVSARLVSPAARHQERMMISAAKTWRFSPAVRDGKPVRYRLRMPITW